MSGPEYRAYSLAPPLDALVDCVWCLSADRASAGDRTPQRIPPDGTLELIFHLRDRFLQIDDEVATRQPAAMVVGVWTRPIAIAAPVAFDTIGIRMRPGCASAFCRAPIDDFTDTVTDAAAVWGSEIERLRDRLGESAADRDRLAVVSAFLSRRLRRRDPVVARSIDLLLAARGQRSIDGLARAAGLSHRRLERAFRTQVGVSPKTLSRIVRFQQVLRRSTPETAGAWAAVAADCGYTDQSHLIRDFTQFTGTTPIQLAAAAPQLADYFRRR